MLCVCPEGSTGHRAAARQPERGDEMTQPMPRAAAPTRCHQFRTRTPFQRAVRGLLVLTALEAVCALGYSVYIVVLVSISETRNTREEYFGAGFLSILAAALVLFVATAVQYGNSY